jgi:hypothetical protein
VLELYLPNAVLVPTLNKNVLQGKKQLGQYFTRLLAKDGLCGEVNSVVAQRIGRSGVFSGIYTFRWSEAGAPKALQARYTYVVVPTRAGARVLTHHSSQVPT